MSLPSKSLNVSVVGSDYHVDASPEPLCCVHHVNGEDFATVLSNADLELGNTAVRMFVNLLLKHAPKKIVQQIQIWTVAWPNVSPTES